MVHVLDLMMDSTILEEGCPSLRCQRSVEAVTLERVARLDENEDETGHGTG
jgi:hypothetical protein